MRKVTGIDLIFTGALFILMAFALAFLPSQSFAKEFKPQKFETKFTITFNSISLEEAARLETVIKDKFKDACKVDVELKKLSSLIDDGSLAVWSFAAADSYITGDISSSFTIPGDYVCTVQSDGSQECVCP